MILDDKASIRDRRLVRAQLAAEMRQAGKSPGEIAAHLGVSVATVFDYFRGQKLPRLSVIRAEQMAELRRQGVSVRDVAERFGCSISTVRYAMHLVGGPVGRTAKKNRPHAVDQTRRTDTGVRP